MDFGLAHVINMNSKTAFMKFRAGTHEYMAPEVKDVENFLYLVRLAM